MLIRAKEGLFAQGDWREATDHRFITALNTTDLTALLSEWKNAGQIFSITEDGIAYFPFYALNPENDYQPYPVIAKVIDIFGGLESGWDMSFWFGSVNSYLGGKIPKAVIANQPQVLLDAVIDELAGILHG